MTKANIKDLEILIETIVHEALMKESDSLADDPLVTAFISPFTDIIKTAKGEIEKTAAVGYSNIANLVKQAGVLAIPFLANSMLDDIQEKSERELKDRLSKINQRYADVLKSNWDTVRKRDVWGLTFMLDPTFGIAEKFILRAPYTALGTLEILTGGHPKVTDLKEKAKRLVQHASPKYADALPDSYWAGDYGMGESIKRGKKLLEQQLTPEEREEIEKINAQIAAEVKKLKSDKTIINAMQSSPVVKQMHAGAVEAIMDTAKPVLSATTYEQLKQVLGKDFDKFEQKFLADLPEDAKSPEEMKKLQDEMVPVIKDSYKKILVTKMTELKKQHPNIVKSVDKLIQKINSM